MSATIVKAALAGAFFCIAPIAAAAQSAGESKSERGMPERTGSDQGKSEHGMPDQTKDAGTPPAKAERAMPAPEKK